MALLQALWIEFRSNWHGWATIISPDFLVSFAVALPFHLPEHMNCIPLFTREELATAFGLLLPAARASELAGQWFDTFGDDAKIDESGRYLYTDWRGNPESADAVGSVPTVVYAEGRPVPSSGKGMYDWLLSMPRRQLEDLLLSFSDFQLDLASLALPDVRRRLQALQGRDSVTIERRCIELQRTLRQMAR